MLESLAESGYSCPLVSWIAEEYALTGCRVELCASPDSCPGGFAALVRRLAGTTLARKSSVHPPYHRDQYIDELLQSINDSGVSPCDANVFEKAVLCRLEHEQRTKLSGLLSLILKSLSSGFSRIADMARQRSLFRNTAMRTAITGVLSKVWARW
jgi:hypothetical protein